MRIIEGTFAVPNFIDPETLRTVVDAAGEPVQFGRRDVPFVVAIPTTVDSPRPVVVYGHGLGGSRYHATGCLDGVCQDFRISSAAVNIGIDRDLLLRGLVPAITGRDWAALEEVVSAVQQSVVNTTFLAKFLRVRLSQLVVDDATATHLIDPDAIHYAGHSNGGTYGYLLGATSPAFERVAMMSGGGGTTQALVRSNGWLLAAALLNRSYDPTSLQIAYSLMQHIVDPIDSINYVHRLVHNRHEGLPAVRAAAYMAVNDVTTRNLCTEWTVRTAGMPMVSNSPKEIWGLSAVDAPADVGAAPDVHALLNVYSVPGVPPGPVTNRPAPVDNGLHGGMLRFPSLQRQLGRFLTEGIFVNDCDGICDPN
jgi:predicted esterase